MKTKKILYWTFLFLLILSINLGLPSITIFAEGSCEDCKWDEPIIEAKPKKSTSKTSSGKKPLLMMEWKILVKQTNGEALAVNPNEFVFRNKVTGYRLEVKVNQSGYLYIVNKSVDGTNEIVFPTKGINTSNNEVVKNQVITIPKTKTPGTISQEDDVLYFEGQQGADIVYLIFSREQIDPLQAGANAEYLQINSSLLQTIKASSAQEVVKQKDPKENNATRVINNNRKDNSDLIETIVLTHTNQSKSNSPANENNLADIRARNMANAIEALRLFHSVQATYQAGVGQGNFGSTKDLLYQQLIDTKLANASGIGDGSPYFGYKFQIKNIKAKGGNLADFTIIAIPAIQNGQDRTGDSCFYVDATGVIRTSNSPTVEATSTSKPIGN